MRVTYGLSLLRLSRLPFHGGPKGKPSGIPVAVICDRGAVVSTGFPSPAAGRGSAAPAHVAPGRTPPLVGQRESEEGLPKGWAGSGIPCRIFLIVP